MVDYLDPFCLPPTDLFQSHRVLLEKYSTALFRPFGPCESIEARYMRMKARLELLEVECIREAQLCLIEL